MDLTFEGFGEEAFAILERLREEPHIEQYRKEKEDVATYLKAPFKRFRDDLAVNWVIPNRLPYETEKNVFSRLLKNDFGAGGCHHHLWMSFYRPGRRRLTDVQLSHSIRPGGFDTGLFVGAYAKDLLKEAVDHVQAEPSHFLALVNPLLQEKNWKLAFSYGSGDRKVRRIQENPFTALPDDIGKATGLWMRCFAERNAVLQMEGALVRWALETLHRLWPLYQFVLSG